MTTVWQEILNEQSIIIMEKVQVHKTPDILVMPVLGWLSHIDTSKSGENEPTREYN